MIAAAKLLKTLQMIEYLKSGRRTRKELMDRFDMSERTTYRYIELFEEVGLEIEQGFDKRFFIIKRNSR
jgi:predicted DNA-binding transcriptional regulator YafY